PIALDPAARTAGNDSSRITAAQIEAMVEKLATRLKEQPNDVEGWTMLGRSYAVLGRHEPASAAFKQALALKPDDPALLTDYADTLAASSGGNLEGEPSRLLARALQVDPNNQKALSLAGYAAFNRKDYPLALRHWEKLAQLAPDSEFTRLIAGGIDEARRRMAGGEPTAAAASASARPAATAPPAQAAAAQTPGGAAPAVSGVVKLAPSLRAKTAPDDTVFIYARAAQGARVPLAILRKQVKDLPMNFALDDSMAMSPAAKLSGAAEVIVSARISKSGQAMPQPGDLQGQSGTVTPGASGLVIEINQVVGQ
ncbi:MAG TPA: tetratricopeptide repeat protein, partial [Burkholderiaceae bacterium]